MRLLVPLILLAASLTAPGSMGDDDEDGTTQGGDALSASEYRKQGNALCREALERLEGIDPPTAPGDLAGYLERGFEINQGVQRRFEALEPPPALRDAHEESVRVGKRVNVQYDELVEQIGGAADPAAAAQRGLRRLFAAPEFERSEELTRELGLDDCTGLSAPSSPAPS